MDRNIENRLVALESRLAHHEKMADELSDVLASQQQTIDLLTSQVRQLRSRVRELETGYERSPQDDRPPPHY
ncbi:SlyX family protein [Telmatospirillum sp.]|uniref:SlyX family protein n=1 Tax=Telmatospirillum sp. TaxID=2079197 RepID=UPI00283BA61B|nr:SlyX family protein [Telmatospirillum sp.]MDR3435933.1 SlyX family protein [Telmatospirillum sp.]